MDTITIKGKKEPITFSANTGIYTTLQHSDCKTGQYSADIYNVDNCDNLIVLVATNLNGSNMSKFNKIITMATYESIMPLYSPYKKITFHLAIMQQLGFNYIFIPTDLTFT